MSDIGIEVWAVDEAGGVAREEGAGFEVAVSVAFVEGAPWGFVLGVALLAVGVGADFPGAGCATVFAEGVEGRIL